MATLSDTDYLIAQLKVWFGLKYPQLKIESYLPEHLAGVGFGIGYIVDGKLTTTTLTIADYMIKNQEFEYIKIQLKMAAETIMKHETVMKQVKAMQGFSSFSKDYSVPISLEKPAKAKPAKAIKQPQTLEEMYARGNKIDEKKAKFSSVAEGSKAYKAVKTALEEANMKLKDQLAEELFQSSPFMKYLKSPEKSTMSGGPIQNNAEFKSIKVETPTGPVKLKASQYIPENLIYLTPQQPELLVAQAEPYNVPNKTNQNGPKSEQ